MFMDEKTIKALDLLLKYSTACMEAAAFPDSSYPTFEETARVYHEPAATVQNWLHQAMKKAT